MSYFSSFDDDACDEVLLGVGDDKPELKRESKWARFKRTHQGAFTIAILFGLVTSNVTDRYVVSAALIDVQDFFGVSKSTAGLLQTIFYLSYMVFSPLVGYIGDRYSRKYLLVFGISLWSLSVVFGSLCEPDQFVWFCLSRSLFGVATASFETVAIPIIGKDDVFIYRTRIKKIGP
jgi:MFS family permease